MKHIKSYQIFESQEPQQHPGFPETKEEIHEICIKYSITNYTINDDLSIDVAWDVELKYKKLTYLPLNFNYVSGDFNCSWNNLTSLEGAPKEVGGDFVCSNNNLTSLKGAPNSVGGFFNCSYNNLTSLKGAPKTVDGDFVCSNNDLTSLKGAPNSVGGSFYCSNNYLTSLKGAPKTVDGHFNCGKNNLTSLKNRPKTIGGFFVCSNNDLTSLDYIPSGIDYTHMYTSFNNNPIYTIVNTFIKNEQAEDLIQEFNEYSIVRGDTVVLGRLEAFISDFDLDMPNLDEVRKHYKIV